MLRHYSFRAAIESKQYICGNNQICRAQPFPISDFKLSWDLQVEFYTLIMDNVSTFSLPG